MCVCLSNQCEINCSLLTRWASGGCQNGFMVLKDPLIFVGAVCNMYQYLTQAVTALMDLCSLTEII